LKPLQSWRRCWYHDTGAYEGDIFSAVYEFGKDGSQSQALVLSIDVNGQKANFYASTFSAVMAARHLAWG
jgi:hypothetical protein